MALRDAAEPTLVRPRYTGPQPLCVATESICARSRADLADLLATTKSHWVAPNSAGGTDSHPDPDPARCSGDPPPLGLRVCRSARCRWALCRVIAGSTPRSCVRPRLSSGRFAQRHRSGPPRARGATTPRLCPLAMFQCGICFAESWSDECRYPSVCQEEILPPPDVPEKGGLGDGAKLFGRCRPSEPPVPLTETPRREPRPPPPIIFTARLRIGTRRDLGVCRGQPKGSSAEDVDSECGSGPRHGMVECHNRCVEFVPLAAHSSDRSGASTAKFLLADLGGGPSLNRWLAGRVLRRKENAASRRKAARSMPVFLMRFVVKTAPRRSESLAERGRSKTTMMRHGVYGCGLCLQLVPSAW